VLFVFYGFFFLRIEGTEIHLLCNWMKLYYTPKKKKEQERRRERGSDVFWCVPRIATGQQSAL